VPTARSDERAMSLAGDVARAAGAIPTVVSAQEHDRIVAILSGLPLAMARALARVGADVADLAGPGFRDATRLAQTSPELADAILGGNAAEVRAALAKLRAALDEVERELG
jgi:prephenate dehydrogenase